ncbi:MAG: biopolymer transport protein ExbD [Polyangiales bacterium]
MTTNGLTVTGSTGKLLPGCQDATTGDVVTVPLDNGRYNWVALAECVKRVKAFADAEGLNYTNADGIGQITMSADPLIEYQDLITAMDAVRADGADTLFPAVLLSAGVR